MTIKFMEQIRTLSSMKGGAVSNVRATGINQDCLGKPEHVVTMPLRPYMNCAFSPFLFNFIS